MLLGGTQRISRIDVLPWGTYISNGMLLEGMEDTPVLLWGDTWGLGW